MNALIPALRTIRQLIRRRYLSLAFITLLWLGITGGEGDSWVLGVPTIVLALVLFNRLSQNSGQPQTLRLQALPGFASWFLWHSLRGGADVARRALTPRLPLRPGFVRYRLSLPPGAARVFLINCLSLLPGTLSADLEGDELLLHALDLDQDISGETSRAERQVSALFNMEAGPAHD